MDRLPALAVIALVVGLPSGTWAYPIPASSAERAARYADWRARLELAERAAQRADWEVAESSFTSVVEEARELEDRSLLVARALDGLGAARARRGALDDAVVAYDEAASLFAELLGPGQPRVAVTLNNLGGLYLELHRSNDARVAFERALGIFERSLGPECDGAVTARRALALLSERPDQLEPAPE